MSGTSKLDNLLGFHAYIPRYVPEGVNRNPEIVLNDLPDDNIKFLTLIYTPMDTNKEKFTIRIQETKGEIIKLWDEREVLQGIQIGMAWDPYGTGKAILNANLNYEGIGIGLEIWAMERRIDDQGISNVLRKELLAIISSIVEE